jgi:hypothetical protein
MIEKKLDKYLIEATGYNFVVECGNSSELKKLMKTLEAKSSTVSYKDFMKLLDDALGNPDEHGMRKYKQSSTSW